VLHKLDQEMSGQLSKIIPPLENVYKRLGAEFGEDVGDYCGRDNTMADRDRVKANFLSGMTPMLYTTFAAGGIGEDLRDSDGDKPRVLILLGAPYSGGLLKSAIRQTWGRGVKSDAFIVLLASDSEPDMQLMQQKIAPRLRALRITVVGERNSLASVMAGYTIEDRQTARLEALAYSRGSQVNINASGFTVRRKTRNVGIEDWSLIDFPLAETAKHKEISSGEEPSDDVLSAEYFAAFCLQQPDNPREELSAQVANAVRSASAFAEEPPEVALLGSSDSTNQKQPSGVASATTTEEEFGRIRAVIKETEQRAVLFLVAMVAVIAFLITQNVSTGWFKGIGQWSLADYLGLVGMIGLSVATSLMLAVLYPRPGILGIDLQLADIVAAPDELGTHPTAASSNSNSHHTCPLRDDFYELKRRCLGKYKALLWGFWVGTAAAFISLLFLVLSEKPHVPVASFHRYHR
jgi:hypothetical protein